MKKKQQYNLNNSEKPKVRFKWFYICKIKNGMNWVKEKRWPQIFILK